MGNKSAKFIIMNIKAKYLITSESYWTNHDV